MTKLQNLLCIAALCVWPAVSTLAIDTAPAFADEALQVRYQHLIGELRCPKCQNETIADSPVGIAADLRREVRELMAAGKSDDEILRFLTDRYGDFVLYRPPFVTRTWLLWFAPAIAIVIGLCAAVRIIYRRSKLSINAGDDTVAASASEADAQ
jgi:cytochrome c-type biogenesis protein CcmH